MDPLRGQVNDFLKHTGLYEDQLQDTLAPYFLDFSSRLPGHCTEEGTDRYYRRSQSGENSHMEVHPDNFKSPFNSLLKLSSIGYGTYMGDPDDMTDFLIYDGVKTSVLSGGVNVLDTAPNYRYMKSERVLGKILSSLHHKYGFTRDELFVASKVGYLPEDAEKMVSAEELAETLVNDYKIPEKEIVRESMHCLHPKFLELQLQGTLERLNLDTLDVYYLQNPYEA